MPEPAPPPRPIGRAPCTRPARGAALLVALAACSPTPAPPVEAGRPARIASLLVLADEVLWELDAEVRGRVVGVSRLADDPTYSAVAGRWPAEVARLSGTAEGLLAHRPDLVIAGSFTSAEVRALLARAGVRTLVIDRFGGFDDFRHNVRAIAGAAGAWEAGEALLARFDRRLSALARSSQTSAGRPTVLSLAGGMVAGAGTTFDDAATAAGLVNVAAQRGITGTQRISLEHLVLWDPHILVVPCGGSCASAVARTRGEVGIGATRAAREGRVVAVPDRTLASTGMAMLDLVAALGRAQGDGPPEPTPIRAAER